MILDDKVDLANPYYRVEPVSQMHVYGKSGKGWSLETWGKSREEAAAKWNEFSHEKVQTGDKS